MKHEQTITFKLATNESGDGVQVQISFDPALPTRGEVIDTLPHPQAHLIAMGVEAAKAAMAVLRQQEGTS